MFIEKIFGRRKTETTNSVVCNSLPEVFIELEKVGFCVLPLIDSYTLNLFREESLAFIEEVKQQDSLTSFLSIGRLKDAAIRNKSKQILIKYLQPKMNELFSSTVFEIIYGTHLLKSNTKQGILNPHQDSSHVDELVYSTYHLWIPVTPPSASSGILQVIPNSHKLHIPYRSLNIPWVLSAFEKNLWSYMKQINIEPGQAVIFNSKLLHASGENKTNSIRIAANLLIKPAEAKFIHCYSEEATQFKKIELFNIDPDFYYTENIMERPVNYPLLKTVDNTNKNYSIKELENIFHQ